jgi:hypothetical protein
LDAALGELNEPDRDALLLRYFEGKSAREMARILGVSDEAAQKRVTRAVDRLREVLARRGVTAGIGGLAVAISAHAVQAAPVGLALSISASVAVAETAVAALTTSTAASTLAMTTLRKTFIATTLAVAIGVGGYEARQVSLLRAKLKPIAGQGAAPAEASGEAALSALRQKINLLESQNGALSNALAQANADKIRLQAVQEQAKHSAELFKELVDQARSKGDSSTNHYPTARHVWAGWGRLGRLSAQLSKDESTLSPEEKAAFETARTDAIGEIGDLMKAMKQLEIDKSSGSASSEEDSADILACVLYGALNLDEEQFQDVYGLLEQYVQEAKEAKESNPLKDASASETEAVVKRLTERAKTDFQTVLTPEQTRMFEDILPYVHVTQGNVGFSYSFGTK